MKTSRLIGAILLLLCAAPAVAQELIWPRIAAGLRIVDGEHPETVMWARHYAQRPLQFSQMLARSEPFLWYIVEAVELRDMPLEIALLPAVESNFDAHARSSQKARGLWQLVPETSRALGLRETAGYDARRDPIASTRAALSYLHLLHDTFDHWLLALGAYNAGRGRVQEAIRKSGSRNFWDLELPQETREHVPRLLGLALLVREPQRFGITLPPIPNRHAAEVVALDGHPDPALALRTAGITRATLSHYNPGLKTPEGARHKKWLLLPAAEAERLRSALAQAPKSVPKTVKGSVKVADRSSTQ